MSCLVVLGLVFDYAGWFRQYWWSGTGSGSDVVRFTQVQ